MKLSVAFSAVAIASLLAVAACSGGNDTGSKGSGSSSGAGGQGAGGGEQSGAGGNLFPDAGLPDDGGQGGELLIYASTDTTLWQLDPKSPDLALTQIGDFDCIGSGAGQHGYMTDIAVDQYEHLWGITGHDVMPLTIEGSVVHCGSEVHLDNAQGQSLPVFYALTFAPAGVLDPALEVLVGGDSAGALWAIDAKGNTEQHGSFGVVPADDGNGHAYPAANVGKAWELSGDIVFLANGGNPIGFATVRDCPNPPSTTGCSKTDTLLEIDVPKLAQAGAQVVTRAVRGQIVRGASCNDASTSYGSMYGIAAWNDKVFGFSRTAKLVAIGTTDGASCLVKDYVGDNFSGAGVTTLAPVVPPPPK